MSQKIWQSIFNINGPYVPAVYVKGMPDQLIIDVNQTVIIKVKSIDHDINKVTVERIDD